MRYGYTAECNPGLHRPRLPACPPLRFLTRDTWGGDANNPMSFNRWNYGKWGNDDMATDRQTYMTRMTGWIFDLLKP